MRTVTLVTSAKCSDFKSITAMLCVQGKIIIAGMSLDDSFSLFDYNSGAKPVKKSGNYKNIPDMAMVGANSFAFIDQGTWFYSDIHLVDMKICQEQADLQRHHLFATDKNCCGISVTEDCYFLTFSGNDNPGYVKMLDSKGTEKCKFTADPLGNLLFSHALSKIYVDPEFRMYVSDTGKKHLTVINVTPVGWRARIDAEYVNTEANCIIQKTEQDLFVAVGGEGNKVALYTRNGPREVICQNELKGTPTALCLAGHVLFVATKTEGWFSSQVHILGYIDNQQIGRDGHIISM